VSRIALFGGSFNPPGKHHREIAAALAKEFDEVVVVPCGPRRDKPALNEIAPCYRAAMVDVTFAGLERVRVDLFDMEASTFTPSWKLDEIYREQGEIWHVVRTDFIEGGKRGESVIQKKWERGKELWQSARFVVIARGDRRIDQADLPPQAKVVEVPDDGLELTLRSRVYHRDETDGLLLPRVKELIERYGLYRGGSSISRFESISLDKLRLKIVADERNPKALEIQKDLSPYVSNEPNLIAVIGGDGTMLRAIRQHWRERIPFYGINTGHLGFLLNDETPVSCSGHDLVACHVALLYVEVEKLSGERAAAVAFNDAWVERATGQTAWIEVRVDGKVRLPQLVADGALVATAAGSTSYARAMGATPVPLNTPALTLVGSNVLRPSFWRPVVLPHDSEIEFRTLDSDKRPLEGYIDGVAQGEIRWLRARASRIAAVELVFAPGHDPAAKLAQIQFPAP